MKKSSFVALVLGTIGGILFALGMCMALIPEWNALKPGIVTGCLGILVLLIMILIWRKMENKPPVRLSGRAIGVILITAVGTLLLGLGMCLVLLLGQTMKYMIMGIVIGIVGIILLLSLIPFLKGLK